MDSNLKDEQQPNEGENRSKRSYETPTLTVHGGLDELTRGSNKGIADGMTGSIITA